MFSLVPLMLSVFIFYLANEAGSLMMILAGLIVLVIGTLTAVLDLYQYRQKRQSRFRRPVRYSRW